MTTDDADSVQKNTGPLGGPVKIKIYEIMITLGEARKLWRRTRTPKALVWPMLLTCSMGQTYRLYSVLDKAGSQSVFKRT